MVRRNPLVIGLLNVLIPGSSRVFVSKDWGKFILSFVVFTFLIVVAVQVGNNIQNVREYTLPQGLCTGILLVSVLAFLFFSGMREATARNREIDSAAYYHSKRTDASKGDQISKLAHLQKQRDEGLISSEEQDVKKAEIESKKK
jgi:hypothetical protein